MFISVTELFKIGIGPSSSHTIGPLFAAAKFIKLIEQYLTANPDINATVKCTLRGSLAFTGVGHATDKAIVLGLNNYTPEKLLKGIPKNSNHEKSVFLTK